MAIGQNAGLYANPIGPFQDPEDYMNMADSMDYFRTFGRAPDSVIESNEKARRKAELIAAIDKITSPEEKAASEPVYGFKKLAEIAKKSEPFPEVSKAQEDPLIKPDMHTNEAFAHYSALRDQLKKKIDDLKAELAFRQKVRKIKARMDPMWKAARIQAIFTGDMTPLTNLFKRYDELEKAERDEKYRYAALDQTKDLTEAAKKQEAEAKQEAKNRAYHTAQRGLDWAMQEFKKDYAKPENRQAVFSAYQNLVNAAEDAGANIVKDEQLIQQKYGVNLRETLGLNSLGFDGAGAPANVPTPAQGNPDDSNTATMYADNFDAAKSSFNMAKVYKEAKASGKVDANTLNGWKNKIEQTYAAEKKAYDAAKKVYDDTEDLVKMWNEKPVKTKQLWDRFLTTFAQRPGIKYVGVNALDKSYTASNKATKPKNEPKKPEL